MATVLEMPPSRTRALMIGVAGVAIILLSFGAALLPSADGWAGSQVVGALLVSAGLIEVAAGGLRKSGKLFAMLAGTVTVVAGSLLAIEPAATLVRATYVIIGWLGLRSIILGGSGMRVGGTIRAWTLLSAATDLILAATVLTGLSAAALTIALFGPTSAVVASFAWILALSFVVTGSYLVGIASAELGWHDANE